MDHAASIRHLFDLVNAGDIDGFGRLLADDFVEREDLPGYPPTKAGVVDYFKMLRTAFPDLQMTPLDIIAGGDKAVARVKLTGTHRGSFMGIAPAGKPIEVMLVDIIRFDDNGRACEHWGIVDQLALMQQLGVVPGAPPS
ncbi:MAG: ester cyclase [Vicinamibacterales bacterium]